MKIISSSFSQPARSWRAILPQRARNPTRLLDYGSGWPRERYRTDPAHYLSAQVDDWKNFQELTWRMAVSLTPKSGKEAVGVVEMKGNTDVDNVSKVVIITNPEVTGTYFPSLDQATKKRWISYLKRLSINALDLFAPFDRIRPKQEAPAGVH